MKFRKPKESISLRKRFLAITAAECTRAQKFREAALITCAIGKKKKEERLMVLGRVAFVRYLQIMIEPSYDLAPPVRWYNGLDSFSTEVCLNFFGFQKGDLWRVYRCLRMPEFVSLENRCKMTGEEVLLRGLYELRTGEVQHNIAHNVFGRDASQQNRAFKWFLNHVYSTFNDLVTDNLEWWFQSGELRRSLEAIERRLYCRGLAYEHGEFDICGFIDCNCLETGVPGSGPACSGAEADRYVDEIQRAFYNGWKSVHGLKHQTFETAHGLTVDIHGPASLRRNDLKLLGSSQLNMRMRLLQENEEHQMRIYGDSIYPQLSHVFSCHKGAMLTERQKRENGCIKGVRISIEWNYGITAKMWPYISNTTKLKILGGRNTTIAYTVCTILRNMKVCLYGSNTSKYFDMFIPENFLENYMQYDNAAENNL